MYLQKSLLNRRSIVHGGQTWTIIIIIITIIIICSQWSLCFQAVRDAAEAPASARGTRA